MGLARFPARSVLAATNTGVPKSIVSKNYLSHTPGVQGLAPPPVPRLCSAEELLLPYFSATF